MAKEDKMTNEKSEVKKSKTINKEPKKKAKLKKDNIIILIVGLILLALIITLIVMTKNTFKSKEEPTDEAKVVDKIDDKYGYYLTETDTAYYKELYNELKKVLTADEIDEDKYATLISQMFAADFYDLNSKVSKSDVGGVQFIIKGYQDEFIKTASDASGMYYYVKNNLKGDRKQELPEVVKTEVVSLKNQSYKYKKIDDDKAYKATVNITYKKDLGYPKTVIITLAHYQDKIIIAEIK